MNLKCYLKENKLTYTDFGYEIGYSKARISQIVHGKRVPLRLAKIIQHHTRGCVKASDLITQGIEKEKKESNPL